MQFYMDSVSTGPTNTAPGPCPHSSGLLISTCVEYRDVDTVRTHRRTGERERRTFAHPSALGGPAPSSRTSQPLRWPARGTDSASSARVESALVLLCACACAPALCVCAYAPALCVCACAPALCVLQSWNQRLPTHPHWTRLRKSSPGLGRSKGSATHRALQERSG